MAKKINFKKAKIAAFGSTAHPKYKAADDPNLQKLVESGAPVCTIFGKSWDFHVKKALKISLDKNLKQVEESCRFLKRHKRLVVFDAEHFFDGFKDNSGYAIDVCRAAVAGGADWIVPCETNGGALPWEVGQFMDALAEILGPEVNLGIHAHNDGGLGTANSLEGVRHGATMVQGTMNGIGERCGNADLCSIIPNLQVKMGHLVLTDNQLKTLTETSRFISEVGNLAHNERLPFVGNSAFAHKGGIHVSAIQKDSRMYEHISPSLVGNHQRVLVSELSGKSNIDYKLKELNIRLPKGSANLSREVVAKIKKLENEGFQFEGAEGSLELLIKKAIGKYKNIFDLNHYRCTIEKRAEELVSEAAVKLTVKGKEEYVVAEGNGPVNALDKALRKALQKFYPSLKAVKLADYKVRVLGSDDGTDARVRVLIESYDKNRVWGTVGVSENIIDASWSALVDSLEYFLHKK